MKTLTVRVPDSVNETDVKMQLAASLFEKGTLSSGQAIELAGVSKREFRENIWKYGVSVFGEPIEDVEHLINDAPRA
jgi:predicted HTH domain antitoxin